MRNKKDKAEIKFINRYLNLHKDRRDDLLKLLEMRNYDVEGYREYFLFLIRYYNCFVDINNSDKLIRDINDKFKSPLRSYELNYTKSAEKAYFKWLLDKRNGYNYYNKTLIKIFDITEDEQKQLKTIISKDEKVRRAKLKNWYNDKRDEERTKDREITNTEIIKMLSQNKTYEEIERL